MNKILYGTTNQSKVEKFRVALTDYPIEILSLKDLDINFKAEEIGKSTEENAILKAKTYFNMSRIPTFAVDYGLYIERFPEDKQPGLNIKRMNGYEATDEEMLKYYISELEKVGGESEGQWISSLAFALSEDKIVVRSFSRETFFTSKISSVINPGEPLSSIQIDPITRIYRSEIPLTERNKKQNDSVKRMAEFLIRVIKISK